MCATLNRERFHHQGPRIATEACAKYVMAEISHNCAALTACCHGWLAALSPTAPASCSMLPKAFGTTSSSPAFCKRTIGQLLSSLGIAVIVAAIRDVNCEPVSHYSSASWLGPACNAKARVTSHAILDDTNSTSSPSAYPTVLEAAEAEPICCLF